MKMITTGDIKISVLVARSDGIKALRAVHHAFNLHESRPGAGVSVTVGTAGKPLEYPRRATIEGKEGNGRWASLTQQLSHMEDIVVSDVLLVTDQGRITIFGLPDQPGICSRVFQAVAAGGIVVDMIVQNLSGPARAELSFSVPLADLERAKVLTREAVKAIDPSARVTAEGNIAKLFVVGVGMRTHTGVARKMFGALAQHGINISMINTSEVRVSVVVDKSRGEEALTCLREAFQLA
jgi:aspartate kinase